MRRLAGVVSLVLIVGCAPGSAVVSTVSVPVSTPVPAPTPTPEQAEAIEVISGAIDALIAEPSVSMVVVSVEGAGGVSEARIIADTAAPTYRSSEVISDGFGAEIMSEQVLVDNTLYARISQAGEPAGEWSSSPVDPELADELHDESFLWFGAVGASLVRIVETMRAVPFTGEHLGWADVAGVSHVRGLAVTFDSAAVADHLRSSGLETMGSVNPSGPMTYEFWISGRLVRLVARGVHFHDGEPIEDVDVTIDYSALSSSADIFAP